MRAFDWLTLLQDRRVSYIERGPNVKRGEINIRCPWCGNADPSQHLGINLDTGWYSCWRQRQGHSGKSPLRLIMKLFSVSYGEARDLAGLGDDYVDPEGFTRAVSRFMGREVAARPVSSQPGLVYSRHFHDIIDDRISTRRWWNYLYQRGFDEADIGDLCHEYELMAAKTGDFESRLIIPYFLERRLVSWTGRAIAPSTIRYKDLSIESSVVPIKATLYNHDAGLEPGPKKTLVVVEGPLDTLKIDFYGKRYGVRSVGLSTNSISEAQLFLLEDLAGEFDQTIVMMDNKTDFGLVDSMRMKQNLATVPRVRIESTPFDRADPGELAPGEVVHWCQNITGVRR